MLLDDRQIHRHQNPCPTSTLLLDLADHVRVRPTRDPEVLDRRRFDAPVAKSENQARVGELLVEDEKRQQNLKALRPRGPSARTPLCPCGPGHSHSSGRLGQRRPPRAGRRARSAIVGRARRGTGKLVLVDLDAPQVQLRGEPTPSPEHVSSSFQELRFQGDLIPPASSVDIDALCNPKNDRALRVSRDRVLCNTQRRRQQWPIRVINPSTLDRLMNVEVREALVEQPMHNDRLGDVTKLVEIRWAPAEQGGLDQAVSSPLSNPVPAYAGKAPARNGENTPVDTLVWDGGA